jgi:hypothetical protein
MGLDPVDFGAIRERRLPKDGKHVALSLLAKTKLGRLDNVDIDRFVAAGFSTDVALEVIAAVAASTVTNYTGSVTQIPLEAFKAHVWSDRTLPARTTSIVDAGRPRPSLLAALAIEFVGGGVALDANILERLRAELNRAVQDPSPVGGLAPCAAWDEVDVGRPLLHLPNLLIRVGGNDSEEERGGRGGEEHRHGGFVSRFII